MQYNNFAISEKSDTFAILNQKVYPSRAHFQTWSTRPLRRCAYAFKPRTTSIRSQTPTGNRNSTPARMAESVDALVSNTSGAIRAGSIPAPGTKNPRRMHSTRVLTFYFPHIPQLSYFWTVIIISGIHLKKIGSANHTILPAVKTALKKCISQRLIPSPALIGLSPQ